jgi:multiple sugar transport system substrate-binding protein
VKRGFRGIIAFLLLLSISTVALSAEKVSLTFMFWGSPAEDAAIRKALKDFETANPEISVTPLYAVYSGAEYDAKMKAMSESGTLPDVGYFGGQFFEYASNGFFMDMTTYVERDGLKKDYIPQTWAYYKDRIYGILTAPEVQVVYYNKKVLQDAGVALPPSDYKKAWTWDQYLSAWKKLTIDKSGKHPGDAGFNPKKIVRFGVFHETWSQMLYPTIWSNNGEVFSEDGKQILIDSPEAIQAIQRLADLRNKDMVMSAPGLTEYNSTSKADPKVLLQNGQIAFYVSGQWELLDFAGMNFPLGIGALPVQKKPAQVLVSGINVIFKQTKHPEESWKLQKWMMSPERTIDLYSHGLWMPSKASWYTDKADLAKWVPTPAHPEGFVGAVLNTMPIARSVVPLRVKNADQIWNEYINPELDLVWLGKQTAEAGMKKAADKIRKSGLLQGNW